jgi:hypothetical protein
VEKVGVKYERLKREIGGIYRAFGKAVLHNIIDRQKKNPAHWLSGFWDVDKVTFRHKLQNIHCMHASRQV